MLNLLVTGNRGRMGQAVTDCAAQDEAVSVSASIDVGDSLEEAIVKCDAVIDFTLPSFTDALLTACVQHGRTLVMGTTGHSDAQ